MKNRKFNQLKNKIALKALFEIILYTIFSMCIILLLIDFLFNDLLAELIFSLDVNLYLYFVGNKNFVIFVFTLITLLIVSFFIIRKTGNYFVEIIDEIDKVLKNPDKDVKLSNVLVLLEGKINAVRLDLINSKNNEKEAINRKNDLIMYMAHDLKTPLTSVIGYLNLIKDEKNISKKTQDKYINIALNKALRVEELTNEFFEITRYNLSEIPLNKSNIDLSVLINQLVEECYPMMEEKNLSFNVKKEETIIINADGDKLARAFENLIKNAINYSYKESTIDINLTTTCDIINITFKNKGEKIPPYKLEKIFDKFYRVDDARESKTGGAGLGLAITKEIILKHDGEISVKNNDEFIEFNIILPKH